MKMRLFVCLVFFGLCVSNLYAQNACDLTGDGVVNSTDVEAIKNMILGTTSCSARILSSTSATCNPVVAQRIINAALTGTCVTGAYNERRAVVVWWDPNSESDLAGYRVYYGNASENYGAPITLDAYTTHTMLLPLGSYYFAVTAYNTSGLESGFSNEASIDLVPDPSVSGWLSGSNITGLKGTTVSVPIQTNMIGGGFAATQFTVTLPLWASKSTVTSGSASEGKTLSCRWQKPGLTSVLLKCIQYSPESLTTISDGVLSGPTAYVNIPTPTTLTGSFVVGISGASGATRSANPISVTTTNGRVTVSSAAITSTQPIPTTNQNQGEEIDGRGRQASLDSGVVVLTLPSRRTLAVETRQTGQPGAPQPPTFVPQLRSLSCTETDDSKKMLCLVKLNVGPPEGGGVITLYPWTSSPELVTIPPTITVEAGKLEVMFEIKVVGKPTEPIKVVIGVFKSDGESVLFDLWP